MPGPEEWRPRARVRKIAWPNRIRPIGSLHSFCPTRPRRCAAYTGPQMNPDARTLWQAPSWALAILLACLGMPPAVAPMVGGFLFVHAGLHSIFWLLTGVGVVLFALNWKLLPETLHESHRQPFNTGNLMRGYWSLASNPRFLMLALASGIPF